MKIKIAADLPSRESLLAGLAPHDVHPPLVRAEAAAAAAAEALDRARRDLADRERIVAALPPRIHAGELRADALAEAMRRRDAAALMLSPAEEALAKARARIAAEEKLATAARTREIERREALLGRTEDELAAALAEVDARLFALARAGDPSVIGRCCAACTASGELAERDERERRARR